MLRMTVRLMAMAVWLAVTLIGYHLCKWLRAHNPWPRRFLFGIARIAGVRLRTTGRPAPGRLLMLANHISWIDVAALAGATGTAFVAHDGLASVPLLKWLCEMNDTIFIARHDRTSIGTQIAALRRALAERGTLTVFPEGTTSDGTALLPFKSALLAAIDPLAQGVTVQPVWIDYGAQTTAIAWVGDEPGVANFKRMLARAEPIALTIHFLEPLAATTLANRKTMTTAAHRAISQAMTADDFCPKGRQ
jgi:1-acyl-sn-glycerol-3-phosphate acyltransferase